MATCSPPDALSIRESEDSYCPVWRQLIPLISVHLGGERQSRIIAYDCDAGWVRFYRADEEGNLLVVDGMPVEVTVVGCVDARWNARA